VPEALDLSDQRLPPGGIEREVLDAVFEDRRIEQAGLDERADEGQVLVPSGGQLGRGKVVRFEAPGRRAGSRGLVGDDAVEPSTGEDRGRRADALCVDAVPLVERCSSPMTQSTASAFASSGSSSGRRSTSTERTTSRGRVRSE